MTLLLARPAVVAALLAVAVGLAWAVGPAAADDGKVKVGQPAPDIALPATQADKALPDKKAGEALHLKDLQGKKNVVLYFFPKAMTRGWTIEACAFRDLAEQFAQLDTVVIGISTDTLKDQQSFTEKEKLNFPLYADAEKKAAAAYGVLSPRGFAQRETFVIDKKGTVRKTYQVKDVKNHPQEVLDFVKNNLAAK